MFRLKKYLFRYKKELVLGPFFKLWEAVFELIIPLVMAKIIDVGIASRDVGYVLRLGGVILGLAAVGFCSTLVCQYIAAKASQGVGTDLRNDMFRHINTLSHGEIDRVGTSSLITRLTNDINQYQMGVAMLIRLAIRTPFLVIGSAIMALTIDVWLSLVFFAAIPLIAVVLFFIMAKASPMYVTVQRKLDRVSLLTRENLSGSRVIRAFSKQRQAEQTFSDAVEDQTAAAVRVARISALMNPAAYAIMNLAIVAIVWFGGYRVFDGALSQGQIIAFVNYMMQILAALLAMANIILIFTKAAASAQRIADVFDTKPSVVSGANQAVSVTGEAPVVRFKDVCFSYSATGENALTDISFDLNLGQTLGIIGATGCGKSTLVQLIPRFYDVTSGTVEVDGIDVRQYDLQALRQKIGMVPQSAVLFSGTIRSNLLWGNESASDEDLWQALRIAQAEDFVRSFGGLDRKVLQGGKNLSGGQRQRLTIARALVRHPRILILDDSSSALDYATDLALRSAIRKISEQMAVIIVSQRAASILSADHILVMSDGQIEGRGTHEQLLESCAEYRQICESQLSQEAKTL